MRDNLQLPMVHTLIKPMVHDMVFPVDDEPVVPAPPAVILHQSVFDPATSTGMVSAGDASANTLGMVFRSLVSGMATQVRFFKTALDTATTRTVGIYDDVFDTLIASGTSVAEPAGPAWITVNLTTPVRIDPMRVYVAAAFYPNGHYAAQANGFATAVKRGFIEALADNDPAVATGNGRYAPGSPMAYPSSNFNAPNYWVDVVVDIPEWVDASNTGVPLGTVLTPYAGNMTVTTNGAIVENLLITGSVTINADNVILRNCKILADGAYHLVRVMDAIVGAKVVDCEIVGSGQAMNGILGRGTIWRNNISGVSNGFASVGPADVRDNYMHHFDYDVPDPHYDGIECNGGTLQTYIHNTIIVDKDQTSCVMLDNVAAGLSQIEVAYNYLSGAGYVAYCDASFSTTNIVDGPSINIHHNACVRGFYGYITLNPGIWAPPEPHDNYDAITGLPIDDPVVKTQMVGTGGEINQTNSAATNSTNTKRGARRRSFLGNADCSQIQFWLAGWTVGADTGEANIPNALATQLHIEINGVSAVVPFNGSLAPATLSPGGNLITNAMLPAAFGLSVFPRGLEFYYYIEQTVAEGGIFPTLFTSAYTTPVPGESYMRADVAAATKIGTTGPLTTGGGWIAGNEVWTPFMVIGKPVAPMMAEGGIGASIEHGIASQTTGDGNGANGGGFCRKGAASVGGSIHIPYVSLARPSEKASTYVASSTHRKLAYPYLTHVKCGHGGNDYTAGATLAANIASNRAIHAAIRSINPSCHISRMELYVKTDSVNYTDQISQTPRTGMETGGAYRDPFNAAFLGDVGTLINAFVKFAPGVMCDVTNLDKWRSDILATTDGTHPLELVHRAMAASESVRLETLRAAYEGAYTYDAATNTLVAGLASPPNTTRKTLIDQTIRWLKNSLLWGKLDVLGLIGDTQEISLRNWKNPGTFNASPAGSPVFTADRQFATAGTGASYMDTGFNPATAGGQYTQNLASFGAWYRGTALSDSSRAGWFDGTDGVSLVPRSSGGGFSFRLNQASTSTNGGAGGAADGLFMANRSGASATQAYSNGVQGVVNTNANQASTALNSHNLQLGAITAAGGVADNYAGWVIGGSFSAVEADILNRAITSYMRKIGAV